MPTNFSFASNVRPCSRYTLPILKIYSTRNVNYRFSELALVHRKSCITAEVWSFYFNSRLNARLSRSILDVHCVLQFDSPKFWIREYACDFKMSGSFGTAWEYACIECYVWDSVYFAEYTCACTCECVNRVYNAWLQPRRDASSFNLSASQSSAGKYCGTYCTKTEILRD